MTGTPVAGGDGSTALLTDRYELTCSTRLHDATADHAATFEVFTRRRVAADAGPPPGPARPLPVPVVRSGQVVHHPSLAEIRACHTAAMAEWPAEGWPTPP